jgi:YbbR domain-containing protein
MLNAITSYRPTSSQIGRFLFSLLLAVLLWAWVTQRQDPFTHRDFSNLTIETTGLQEGLQIITTLPTARVTINGARSDLNKVDVSQVTVSLDTSSVKGPGQYRVPVRVGSIDGTTSRSVVPNEVQIQVDQTESKVFPLKVVPSSPGAGDARQIGTVTPAISQVTVNGSASAVNRVAVVQLPIAIGDQTTEFTGNFTPIAVDANGQQISEVTILPATISAKVPVQTRGKYVSVVPKIIGVPAEGYSIQARASFPETILVDGPQSELDQLLFVDTEPVDVTGATQSISRDVKITGLPSDLTVLEPSSGIVEVRVAIEDITSQTAPYSSIPVTPINVGDGLTATIDPATVTVSIDASRSVLQTMSADDVKVRVDLKDLGPGIYHLTPDVTLPQRASWLGNNPSTVKVVITRGTPVASPPASPQATPERSTPQSDRPKNATPSN